MDHWSGNDEFRKAFPGIQIIATAETRRYMTRMGSSFLIDGTRAGLARSREALDTAIKTGKSGDGTVLTDDLRKEREEEIAETARFVEEISAVPRVVPDMAFHDELTFWRGSREFRLFSMTGDATGSAVLYLPAEKVLVTGDVFVSPPDEQGPPPWTTNSFAIRPISQVQSALERGIFKTDDVLAAVDVDAIGRRYPLGRTGPNTPFEQVVAALTRKTLQESLDGVVR
jgi:glyoxylase-like metal-dependent hydrolase (beta-lactamase superfamily II)